MLEVKLKTQSRTFLVTDICKASVSWWRWAIGWETVPAPLAIQGMFQIVRGQKSGQTGRREVRKRRHWRKAQLQSIVNSQNQLENSALPHYYSNINKQAWTFIKLPLKNTRIPNHYKQAQWFYRQRRQLVWADILKGRVAQITWQRRKQVCMKGEPTAMWNFDKVVKVGSRLLLVIISSSAKVNILSAILNSWILLFRTFWLQLHEG